MNSKQHDAFKFDLEKMDINTANIDYDVQFAPSKLIDVLSEQISEHDYHEICHQLFGHKSEYNTIDGEYEDGSAPLSLKKFHAVKDSLYRGVFWTIMSELKENEEEALANKDGLNAFLENTDTTYEDFMNKLKEK